MEFAHAQDRNENRKARLKHTSNPSYTESMCEDYKTVVYIIKRCSCTDNIKYTVFFILFSPHSPQQWIKLMKIYGSWGGGTKITAQTKYVHPTEV